MVEPTKTPHQFMVEDAQSQWLGENFDQVKRFAKVSDVELKISRELEQKIRTEFYEKINPSVAAALPKETLIQQINDAINQIVDDNGYPLNWAEQNGLALNLLYDMLGVGPLEYLLKDNDVTDILVNGFDQIFVERSGVLEKTTSRFRDEDHLLQVARRIASSVGRRIDESSPMVDARLPDGSRVNIIIQPLSVHGSIVSIRKFPKELLGLYDLIKSGALSEGAAAFLALAAEARLNILISGGTGSGKTTLLNAMSRHIKAEERVVTIEDAAEINLQKPHVISLETRQRNIEGEGEVSQRDLLRNALRMRPDRIIIGEVRGAEAHEMLQAMNTGHDGSMSTIHANSARDALNRLEDLILSHYTTFQSSSIRRQMVSSLDIIVHLSRDMSGQRYVANITEVVGQEIDTVTLSEIYSNTQFFEPEKYHHKAVKLNRLINTATLEKIKKSGLSKDLERLCDA